MDQSMEISGTSKSVESQRDVITKAIQLFTDKHSVSPKYLLYKSFPWTCILVRVFSQVHMVERHIKALERISRICSHGFVSNFTYLQIYVG